jgi:hypothetical protein
MSSGELVKKLYKPHRASSIEKRRIKMFQSDCLTEQQKGVLEDLFSGTLSVREVLEKRQVDRSEKR